MSERVWYRSLYWRIAVGSVVLLAVILLVQGLLFLWLTGRFVDSPSSRTPQELADMVAREISDALGENPVLDLEAHVRGKYGDLTRPFLVILRDGRRAANRAGLPPGFMSGPGAGRRAGMAPNTRDDDDRPRVPPEFRGGRGGRGGRPNASLAPIVLDGVQEGIVAVPAAPPPLYPALRELGPALAWAGLGLLAIGSIAVSLLVFRPARRRLRSLEDAARALGEGRTDVRADDSGGDEVSALARTFNQMAGDLRARQDQLAASDAARRQLLADVSHELMTPLTAIRGYVQTLEMSSLKLDEQTRLKYLNVVDQETHKLEAIIGDLLDLARLEGGGGDLVFEKVPISHLFGRVSDRHRPALTERRITLETSIAPPSLEIRADADKFEQALQNIVANAVRHTPDGGRIELRAQEEADRVRITLRDTGPGIDAEHLPHLFDRFYKADASRTAARASGSGIGLSIVRAIVRRHGGTVRATNHPDGGAVFEIELAEAK
jgi:signal transduction histidine kinase